jgi:hypothetical protein
MEDKLNERKQVVDTLLASAIVTVTDEGDELDTFRVVVPGAVREANIVKAVDSAEALEKVRSVLYLKEQSRLEGQVAFDESADNVELSPDDVHVDAAVREG